ncbi:distal membrane-arm assembly complex protein 2 [Zerene cesonia]|uniref:distal membrane-arm assembly complex protein 2 n=1 Tax=Zerene cesonia TaxID=33412 RepID=UPI0018E518CA|nr:distal membrane-arm assembly complex protein 2 [Zerene cesonia]
MAFNIKNKNLLRRIYSIRHYSESENKTSIYEKHEAGPQPRKVYDQVYTEWRKPWIKREGEQISKLNIFVEKNPSMSILNAMQKIPHITFEDVKEWWIQMKELQEIENQKYLPERVTTLGHNLAAVHFFTYRQATVRLRGSKEWIGGDITELKLPSRFIDGYFVEAVDCTNFHRNGIRYEGIQNLTGLNFLKWLSLKGNKHVDVWCLDRLAGQNGNSLEYLDITGCNICVGSILALARMRALKFLVLTDPGDDTELQAALSCLEEENPDILIKTEMPT